MSLFLIFMWDIFIWDFILADTSDEHFSHTLLVITEATLLNTVANMFLKILHARLMS